MVGAYRFRFTLGQTMVVIAVSAVVLAAIAYGIRGSFVSLALLSVVVGCAGLVVFVSNLRLSGWLWLVIIGHVGPGLVNTVAPFLYSGTLSSNSYGTLILTNKVTMSLCSVVGFAMTFRDIRRKLAIGGSEESGASKERT